MTQAPELRGVRVTNLFWLTDEQMERLKPFFPKSHGKPRVDDRRVLSGISFINRSGLRWCDAPRECGSPKTLYYRWKRRGDMTELGLDVVRMETRQVKGALKAMPIKTDRRDAEGIAPLLHLGWFRPVHCKSVSVQEVRAVLDARKSVQQRIIALEISLRGLLQNFGLKVGTISRGRFEHRIRELTMGNPMLEAATEPMLRARLSLRQELAGLERSARQLALEDQACRRMMSMPGVGAVVALTYRSAVDDPSRFPSSKKVGPWVGLTPSQNQSGELDVSGGITKAGDVNLRRALCEAATVMMHRGRSTLLRTWAAQVARRWGSRRAMVALARRIGVIPHCMWIDDMDFHADGPAPNAA